MTTVNIRLGPSFQFHVIKLNLFFISLLSSPSPSLCQAQENDQDKVEKQDLPLSLSLSHTPKLGVPSPPNLTRQEATSTDFFTSVIHYPGYSHTATTREEGSKPQNQN